MIIYLIVLFILECIAHIVKLSFSFFRPSPHVYLCMSCLCRVNVVRMLCMCHTYVPHESYVCVVAYGTCIVRYVYRAVRVSCGTCMCACMRACVCVRAFVYVCVCVFFEWLNNNGHFS